MMLLIEHRNKSKNSVTETLKNIMSLKKIEDMMSQKVERDSKLELFKAISSNPAMAEIASKIMNVELPKDQEMPTTTTAVPGNTESNTGSPSNLQNSEITSESSQKVMTPNFPKSKVK